MPGSRASSSWRQAFGLAWGVRRRTLFDRVRASLALARIVAGNAAEALAAHQDGMPFSAWVKQAGCARSTASKWAEACAVRIRKELNPATGRQESWLSGHDVVVLNDYRRQLQHDQKPTATVVSLAPGNQVLPAAWLPQPAPEPVVPSRTREEEREALDPMVMVAIMALLVHLAEVVTALNGVLVVEVVTMEEVDHLTEIG